MVPLDLRDVIFGRVGARPCGGCGIGVCECGELCEEVKEVIEALRPLLVVSAVGSVDGSISAVGGRGDIYVRCECRGTR